MMLRFVTAINALGSQAWAFIMVITGVVTIVICHKSGIEIGIGSGVIGAGVNMFTSQASKSTLQTSGDHPATLTQTTEAPGIQPQGQSTVSPAPSEATTSNQQTKV